MKVYPEQLKKFLPNLNWDAETLATNLSMIGHEAEVVGDALEVKIFPNRGDVLSLRGLSRDLAALYAELGNWQDVEIVELPLAATFYNLSVESAAKPYVLADHLLKIEGYAPTESPDSVKALLKPLGLQPKDLLIDLTNVVTYEVGVPLHSFDMKTIAEGMTIDLSSNDEQFISLNNITLKLPDGLLIARNSQNQVTDLLGTMGGKNSAVSAQTQAILLQAAAFAPAQIRKNSRQSGIATEASYRYQRGVDPRLMSLALGRFVYWLKQSLPDIRVSAYQTLDNFSEKIEINIEPEYVSSLLGVDVSQKNIGNLTRLGFEVGEHTVTVPSWRFDVTNAPDVAEDIARQIGLNNIPAKNLTPAKKIKNTDYERLMNLKHALAQSGLTETLTYSFAKDGPVILQNPRSEDQRALRSSLKEGLLKTVARNPFLPKSMFFEIGTIFLPEETTYLGLIISGYKDKQLAEIEKSLEQTLGKPIKLQVVDAETLAKNDVKQSRIFFVELPLDQIKSPAMPYERKKQLPAYKQVSKFPPVVRDVTLTVEGGTNESTIIALLKDHPFVLLVEEVDRFESDEQLGAGKVALTFRIILQHLERSLTDEEATSALEKVFHNLSDKVKFEQR